MTPRTFGWQSDDLEHTAEIEADHLRWATVTDAYDDDRPYTAGTEQQQSIADFIAGGPAVRAPIAVLEEMAAALGKPVQWIAPLRVQYAAEEGDLAALRAQLAAGAPINAVVRGKTALSAALEAEQVEAAAALLEGGADPKVRLAGGATALHIAARNAKSSAWMGVLQALLLAGADLGARNDEGQTPLLAGLTGHLSKEGVEVLVADPRAVNEPSADGTTPLIAETRGWCRPSVVRMLLAAGAHAQARGKDGWSALLWAITKHDARIVKMLIDAGADVNIVAAAHKQGQPGRSALRLAESYAGGRDAANPQVAQIVEHLRAAGAAR
jgi:ankyrin repeat protein